MTSKYIISDTHFNHTNIIKYENRPFKDVIEMNEYMVKQWNSIVGKKDMIFHLGDFCFGKFEEIQYWFNKLNGRKILIMGNHDRHLEHRPIFWEKIGFEEVYRYPIIYKPNIILSHEPIQTPSSFINIHGHVHTNKEFSKVEGDRNVYINLSVEEHDYKPVNLDKLIDKIQKNNKSVGEDIFRIINNSKDIDPEVAKIINDNFWDLI